MVIAWATERPMTSDVPRTPVSSAQESRADDAVAATRPVKRSFSIAGHRTSISLEQAFWHALRTIAQARDQSVAALVTEIDRERGEAGLSSAVRVWILEHYRQKSDR